MAHIAVYVNPYSRIRTVRPSTCNVGRNAGAIYMYKIMKKWYKIRLLRDCFETCNK